MLVYINLIEFLLLLGVIFITFFSELVNPVKVTRIISNLSLFFIIYALNYCDLTYISPLSFLFIALTCFLLSECALSINETSLFLKPLCVSLLLIGIFLIGCFIVEDLLLFYIFFEAILIPMYILVGLWGSRERKIRAVYLLFFYTLVSSLFFLLGILYLFYNFNTTNIEWLIYFCNTYLSNTEQYSLWLFFFFSFASKIPMFPLHIWLPEAHVEAPTIGSVLLAGILLKLGVYGFLRFSLSLFESASVFFSPLIYTLCVFGIIYASFSAIRQTDIKRIIAYSSVAHMNLVVIGIFSFTALGIEGAVFQSLSHGFVAGSLFFLIGFLYNRYHSRFLSYYGGLVHFMPIYAIFFLFFTLSNIALPTTSSFVGEFLLLFGIFKFNSFIAILSAFGVILCGAYSLWLYNKIIFGNIKNNHLLYFIDLDIREIFILLIASIIVIILGIYPSILFEYCHSISYFFVSNLISNIILH
jgi:NADH-quinone oxidoreductase subunit M